jgi:drug/metabolite transporter (DMT)-like permease
VGGILLGKDAAGYALAATASVLWASLAVFGRFLLASGADPASIVAVRALLAAVMLGATLACRRRSFAIRDRSTLGLLIAYGAIVACNYASYFSALKRSSVATAATLLYTYPAVVVILGVLAGTESLTLRKSAALALTLSGSLLVAGFHDPAALKVTASGALFGAGASLTMALYAIAGKELSKRCDPWVVVMYGFAFAAVFLWIGRGPRQVVEAALRWRGQEWLAVVALALFPTLLAYGLFTYSMRFIEASTASMVACSEPVLATLFAWAAWGEPVTPWQAAGGALVIVGVVVLAARPCRRRLQA